MLSDQDVQVLKSSEGLCTFDVPIETGQLSIEAAIEIIAMEHYGKPITEQAINNIQAGKKYSE